MAGRREVPTVEAGQAPVRVTKGERTRRNLMATARRILEDVGYHDMKVTEVAREAGVSAGVFYIYFKDKEALALAVFAEAIDEGIEGVFSEPAPSDPFLAIVETNRRYCNLILGGGGLMRAIAQILDQLPEARALWLAMNSRVARRVATALERREPGAIAGEQARVFTAHAAQAMIDMLLLNLVSYRNADIAAVADDRERLVEALSILWFRLLHGRSPDPGLCRFATDFLPTAAAPVK
jgi:AcrR family transcriptional regulator